MYIKLIFFSYYLLEILYKNFKSEILVFHVRTVAPQRINQSHEIPTVHVVQTVQ